MKRCPLLPAAILVIIIVLCGIPAIAAGALATPGCDAGNSSSCRVNPSGTFLAIPGGDDSLAGGASLLFTGSLDPIRTRYRPGEITVICDAAVTAAGRDLDRIAAVPADQRSADTTLLPLESTLADLQERATPLSFMGYVATDPAIATEGTACEVEAAQYSVAVFSRKDLYDAVKNVTPRSPDEAVLLNATLGKFQSSGLDLPDKTREEVMRLRTNLTALESQFSANLNADTSTVEFTEADVSGVPADFIKSLEKTADGRYIVPVTAPAVTAVVQGANSEGTRKAMLTAYLNRAAGENTRILEEAIVLRGQIARDTGYGSWAEYQLTDRIARDPSTVFIFLNTLKGPVVAEERKELAGLLAIKQEIDPNATGVNAWDLSYLEAIKNSRESGVDDREVRKYFPLSSAETGMFSWAGSSLGITIAEVPGSVPWAPGVTLYRISDSRNGTTLGYVYFDLLPRQGKYGWAATFPLRSGRLVNGSYVPPVSAIVANFEKPAPGTPVYMTQDDLVTLFHEFGHVTHFTLSRAPYASLSAFDTPLDFVETPSQMFQDWAYSPMVLEEISAIHPGTAGPIPPALAARVVASAQEDPGIYWGRVIAQSLTDMEYHTADGPVDVDEVYNRVYSDVMGMSSPPGSHFPATFDHIMSGYDAGYYSYLWSKVYAEDIYSEFAKGGLRNATTGARYRTDVLAPGAMQDPREMIRNFLGRNPGPDAFYARLGIGNVTSVQPDRAAG